MTGIINYGAGNIFSVMNTIERLDEKTLIISEPEQLSKVHRIILPGVGAFDEAMQYLKNHEFVDKLKEEMKKGKPILGICLGLQTFFEKSEEGKLDGLKLLRGCVKKFPERKGYVIPHMGWNSVKILVESDFVGGVPNKSFFYFAHSYYPVPEEANFICGTTEYGLEFASIVQKENLIGVQFHPEKSASCGLIFLENFIKMR